FCMFETITSAIIAHKQILIAAIAITGLITYSVPTNMLASAQSFFFPDIPGLPGNTPGLPVDIDVTRCEPYCNNNVNVDIDELVHIHIGFL
ncbi:MAG TPA: hypothetical protein VKA87_08535, partial [Nitrososphaeraceae archaeon]|nr:hypothetical protein [Nitrososphaeraceae archaeon]